jgi:hypothetical protein
LLQDVREAAFFRRDGELLMSLELELPRSSHRYRALMVLQDGPDG